MTLPTQPVIISASPDPVTHVIPPTTIELDANPSANAIIVRRVPALFASLLRSCGRARSRRHAQTELSRRAEPDRGPSSRALRSTDVADDRAPSVGAYSGHHDRPIQRSAPHACPRFVDGNAVKVASAALERQGLAASPDG